MMNKYFLICCAWLLIGCQKQDITFEKLNDHEGLSTFWIKFKDKSKMQISFDSLGNLNSIYNMLQDGAQSVHYFSNGMIEAKVMMDSKISMQGRTYYFHEHSGHLVCMRQFKNDTLNGYQFDYYDQEGTDSMVQHYIMGCCMGRLVLDKKEKAISVSGSFIAK